MKMKFLTSVSCLAFGLYGASASADIVQVDDVIIQQSLCVGVDCVNGEDFGFDTVRLKENNLRIAFVDTSATSAFPGNDWQLVANDSASGGASYFSILDVDKGVTPFRVDAGSIDNALYIDSAGDVGIGTSTPVVELHAVDGNTPALRLEQNASSGFTSQIWDLAGNENNFFVRDVTNGSALPFRIEPGTPQNALYMDSSSNIGIGLANPSTPLHVKRATGALLDIARFENDGDTVMVFANTAAGAATPEWKIANFQGNFFIGTPTTAGIEFLLSNTGNLTISGNFISRGTTLNVPDYVFEDDYDLMSLAQVRDFIDTNGHLPRIPSADEIASSGINMSEMQMALLEKIEELTLYTIDQKDELAEQAARIAGLESTLARLSAE